MSRTRTRRTRAIPVDIRDVRLPGGRLCISSRTTDGNVAAERKAALYRLLDLGAEGLEILERLRARRLRIETVTEAVQTRTIARLLSNPEPEPAPKGEPAGTGYVPIRVGAVAERFLARAEANLAPGTALLYRQLLAAFRRAFPDEREIASISAAEAEAWLHATGWGAGRRGTAHNVLHQVWDLALAEDEERAEQTGAARTIPINFWGRGRRGIPVPKERRRRVLFCSRAQAGRLLWQVRGLPEGVFLALALYAGLRRGEALHLRVGHDVDPARPLLLRIQPHGGRGSWRPKTDNSVRDVPVSRRLARWIRAHHRAGYAGEVYLIHPAKRDHVVSDEAARRWVRDAFGAAGVRYGRDVANGMTYHTLRHTFASWLASQDTQLKKIALLLGDTTEMVDKTYAHLLPSDLAETVERIGRKAMQ